MNYQSVKPPLSHVKEWSDEVSGTHFPPYGYSYHIATRAAQWGADQELEACVKWLEQGPYGASITVNHVTENLRAAMRPKPPTLKEQALALLETRSLPVMLGTPQYNLTQPQVEIIRKALEQLPDE